VPAQSRTEEALAPQVPMCEERQKEQPRSGSLPLLPLENPGKHAGSVSESSYGRHTPALRGRPRCGVWVSVFCCQLLHANLLRAPPWSADENERDPGTNDDKLRAGRRAELLLSVVGGDKIVLVSSGRLRTVSIVRTYGERGTPENPTPVGIGISFRPSDEGTCIVADLVPPARRRHGFSCMAAPPPLRTWPPAAHSWPGARRPAAGPRRARAARRGPGR